jgi:hypothetical protein
VLRGIGSKARDRAGLVVIFEEDGCPAVGGGADQVLGAGYGAFELRECVIFGRGLEFVGALADVYYVLLYLSICVLLNPGLWS